MTPFLLSFEAIIPSINDLRITSRLSMSGSFMKVLYKISRQQTLQNENKDCNSDYKGIVHAANVNQL
jgi:hypothetical protein